MQIECYQPGGNSVLEGEFCCELHEAWSGSTLNLAEAGILSLSVHRCWAVELSMIEGVESLCTEFERFSFGEAQVLLERHIEIFNSGSIEISALRVA